MAKNKIACGDVLDYTAGGTITSGQPVLMGDLLGVALKDGVSGDVIPVAVEGVFEVKITSGQTPAIGTKVYWDGTDAITTTVGSNKVAGYVAETVASGATTVKLRLIG